MEIEFIFTVFVFVLFFNIVFSSHFLGGTITWRVENSLMNSSTIDIRITQTYSWTYIAGRCDGNAIATNQLVAGSGGVLSCSPSCPVGFGSISAMPFCTDVSPRNGIAVGQRSDVVSIPVGSNFSVIYASGSWGGLALGGGLWSISSRIELQPRSDNGFFNNAPVAIVMSPINIQQNQKTFITISVSDSDGDTLRCRWASASNNGVDECSSVCPPGVLPPNTTIYSNCTIEITGTVVGNRYAVALMVSCIATLA